MLTASARWAVVVGSALLAAGPALANEPKPAFEDFMGLNGHSTLFRPTLYDDNASLVRDYHNLNWDIFDGTGTPNFNKTVNWTNIYDSWVDQGFRINTAIQFGASDLSAWGTGTQLANAAKTYGREFAKKFGSAPGGNGLVSSVQIGNEPGDVSDAVYKEVFRNMAQGIREIDPTMKIVTCNVTPGASHQYAKSLSIFDDATMKPLVDVFATHSYPMIQGWPTWERTYPEDPRPGFKYLSDIQGVIDWRNTNAAGKQVWLTEFGYDASTQQPNPNTEFAQWKDVTDLQQAQYLTRSFLRFANMDLDRAYMFWANDSDNPQLHGSSGLTRNYNPKQSYWAMKHLKDTLGEYAFVEAIQQSTDLFVYAFKNLENPDELIWAVWSPTGNGTQKLVTLDGVLGEVLAAEQMALTSAGGTAVGFTMLDADSIRLNIGESPTYLHMLVPEPVSATLLALGGLALLRRPRHA